MPSESSLSADPRVRSLFEKALQQPSVVRAKFVKDNSRGDGAVADHVLSLLSSAEERVRRNFGIHSEEGSNLNGTATFELLQKLVVAAPLDTVRYRTEGQLGRGGMGAVMSVRDAYLNRQLAMKVMLDYEQPRDEFERKVAHQMLGRFLEEAQVTSQLDHPGVVPVHELGVDAMGKVFFTMRLVKGETLRDIFDKVAAKQDGWTRTRALEAMLKVCDTIAFAHNKGVLHRDLKPANIMVGRFGEVYVVDWGLAKVMGQDDRHDLRIREQTPEAEVTVSARTLMNTARRRDADTMDGASIVSMDGQQLGTPTYMAPEQARSEPLDERADIYSLGAMLYTLLAGRPPYTSPDKNLSAYRTLEMVIAGPPERIESTAKGVPGELVAIAEKAMARNKVGRYQKVENLVADIRAFLDQKVVHAYETGALAEMRMWVRRNKPLAMSLAGAVMALVAGITASVWFGAEWRVQKNEAIAATAEKERALQVAKEEGEKATAAANDARNAEQTAKDQKGKAERALEELKAKNTRVQQLRSVLDCDRIVREGEELFTPYADSKARATHWLFEAKRVLTLKTQFERDVKELEGLASGVAFDSSPEVAHYASECQKLEQHLAWLQEVDDVRAGRVPSSEVPLPEKWARPSAGRKDLEDRWFKELNEAANQHARNLETDVLLGELREGHASGRDLLAACNALLEECGKDNVSEVVALRFLAWARVANGLDEKAREALTRAAKVAANLKDTARVEQATLALRLLPAKIDSAAVSRERVVVALDRARKNLAIARRKSVRFPDGEEGELSRLIHMHLSEVLERMQWLETKRDEVRREVSWKESVERLRSHWPAEWVSWPDVETDLKTNLKYAGSGIRFDSAWTHGLAPIGINERSRLWEFYDLRSAWDGRRDITAIVLPTRDPQSNVDVTSETGIVFVLLPGGEVEDARTGKKVRVAPFLMARHELTQGQWSRLWRRELALRYPSDFVVGKVRRDGSGKGVPPEFASAAHPVENVAWRSADQILSDNGMHMPTGAQWEHACRATTTTPWAFAESDLPRACNLADRQALADWRLDPEKLGPWDGHRWHARVGSYMANKFGLHDMHGNVFEWCDGDDEKLIRGGSFADVRESAQSAELAVSPTGVPHPHTGVRAARSLTHE